MRVSVAIQVHPLRLEMAADLAGPLAGELVLDPEPEAGRNPWRTYRLALERTPPEATHRLILQDDAEPCRWFREAMHAAVAARPDRLLVLFVGGRPYDHAQAILRACKLDRPWAELRNDRWCPAVALVWPAPMIEPFLEFVDAQNWPPSFTADDEIICRYLQESRQRPLASVPSLVEHPDVVPSIHRGRPQSRPRGGEDAGRVAVCPICDDCDARQIDWSLPSA